MAGLAIEPNRPSAGTPFAFVAPVPALPKHLRHDRDAWHRCSYCETNKRFVDGRIVLCGDGLLRTIGVDCWQHHIEEAEWTAAVEEWGRFRRRERFLAMRDQLFPTLLRLQWQLATEFKLHMTSVAFADGVVNRVYRLMPRLADELAKASKAGGSLTVERRVQDFAAMEGSRGQRNSQRDTDAVRYKAELHTVFTCRGVEIFLKDGIAGQLLDGAVNRIILLNDRIRRIEWETIGDLSFTREANHIEKGCRSIIADVATAIAHLRSVRTFFSAPNVAGIVRWASDHDCELCLYGGEYDVVPAGICYSPDRGDTVSISLPAGYTVLEIEAFEKLKQFFI